MKQADIQEAFHQLFSQAVDGAKYDINVADLAKVVKYNKATHTADVQPLVDDGGGRDDVGIINDCPVLYPAYAVDELRAEIIKMAGEHLKGLSPRVTMKAGATVYVVYNNRDIDNFDGGKYTKASERMHDVNDAVVVGVKE